MRIFLKTCLLLPSILATAQAADDWPLYGLDYSNQRLSPLVGIKPENVAQLTRRWSVKTGIKASFQSSPVVREGVMYVSTPFNHVLALDAATGAERWRYEHALTTRDVCCGPANRGVAVADGRVFMATIDSRVVALDAATGAKIWESPLVDHQPVATEKLSEFLTGTTPDQALGLAGSAQTGQTGYSANMAPQVVDGLVLVGVTGTAYGLHVETRENGETSMSVVGLAGEQLGLRGFIVALDAATGKERWRWHTVPDAAWTGQFTPTTAYGETLNRDLASERARSERYAGSWQFGGGSVWTTPAVDRARGLIFIGTGNPAPQMDDATRPGDNLHTVSLVALELQTGKLVWAYQQVPHDRWGYDVASPPVLFTVQHEGKPVEAVGQASKLGWFFVHARATGRLLYRSVPFAPQENLFTPPTEAGVRISPSGLGACSWSPVAVDETAGTVFIAGSHGPADYFVRKLPERAGQAWDSYTMFKPAEGTHHGLLSALNLADGSLRWQVKLDQPMVGGVLATRSGLVFTGEGRGRFVAFDGKTGARLWEDTTEAGVNAPPVSYAVAEEQFVAVAAGGNSLYGYPVGDEIIAWALPRAATP